MGDNLKKLIGSIYRKYDFQNEFHEVIVVSITEEFLFVKWNKTATENKRIDLTELLTKGSSLGINQPTVEYFTETGKAAWKPPKVEYKPYANISSLEASMFGTVRAWRKTEETPPQVN